MSRLSAFSIPPNSLNGIVQPYNQLLPKSNILCRALKPPGYHKEWHIGVRVSSNKKLVAFISGVPITLRVRGK